MRFSVGSPDDGVTGIVSFPEAQQSLSQTIRSRTVQQSVAGFSDEQFEDSSKFLPDAI